MISIMLLIAVVVSLIIVYLLFSGFFERQRLRNEPHSTVFVIGARMNSRAINFSSSQLNERLEGSVNSFGFVGFVVADGEPANQMYEFDLSLYRPNIMDDIFNPWGTERALTSSLLTNMQNYHARVEEAAVLEAIILAARMLSDRPEGERREIVVLGTGLSTEGWLNFTDGNNWINTDAETLVDALVGFGNLPNLYGIYVSWFQMHDVGYPQRELPNPQRSNLEEIWRLIVMSGGATGFNLVDATPYTVIYDNYFFYPHRLPDVSVIYVSSPVTGVSVFPQQADVQRGTSQPLNALVEGFGFGGPIPQDVEWSIEGPPDHPDTILDEMGNLHIADSDTREYITVIARSVADPRIFGSAIIRLIDAPPPPPIVTGILVFPEELVLGTHAPHNIYHINVVILGENSPPQTFTLELFGNTDPNTRIYQNGRIFIGLRETAFLLTLRITSMYDPAMFIEIPIRIFRETPDVVEVNFVGNTAEFVNIVQARDAVSEWVDFINTQNTGIFLFGCTADTGHGGTGITLGQERANAVRDLLIHEFNVASNRIETRGLGHNNPWNRPNGISGTPSWNETVAASNRIVVIMSADDELAQGVYNGTWR